MTNGWLDEPRAAGAEALDGDGDTWVRGVDGRWRMRSNATGEIAGPLAGNDWSVINSAWYGPIRAVSIPKTTARTWLPEPQTEGSQATDDEGDVWTLRDDGLWHCFGITESWKSLNEAVYGPVRKTQPRPDVSSHAPETWLPEPEIEGAQAVDRENSTWTRRADGLWHCLGLSETWRDLNRGKYGPIRKTRSAPEDAYLVGDRIEDRDGDVWTHQGNDAWEFDGASERLSEIEHYHGPIKHLGVAPTTVTLSPSRTFAESFTESVAAAFDIPAELLADQHPASFELPEEPPEGTILESDSGVAVQRGPHGWGMFGAGQWGEVLASHKKLTVVRWGKAAA